MDLIVRVYETRGVGVIFGNLKRKEVGTRGLNLPSCKRKEGLLVIPRN